jgi:hypothetical protein
MGHFSGRTHCGRARGASLTAEPSYYLETASGPSHDEIAHLAYSYWDERGRQGGSAEDDWYRAEAELRRLRR